MRNTMQRTHIGVSGRGEGGSRGGGGEGWGSLSFRVQSFRGVSKDLDISGV